MKVWPQESTFEIRRDIFPIHSFSAPVIKCLGLNWNLKKSQSKTNARLMPTKLGPLLAFPRMLLLLIIFLQVLLRSYLKNNDAWQSIWMNHYFQSCIFFIFKLFHSHPSTLVPPTRISHQTCYTFFAQFFNISISKNSY
eukprot:Sdes_comp16366_c0_seq1m5719